MSGFEEGNNCSLFDLTLGDKPRPWTALLLSYLTVTAHLVALAQALLLGGTQGVPGHDVITEGHMHAIVGFRLACKDTTPQ